MRLAHLTLRGLLSCLGCRRISCSCCRPLRDGTPSVRLRPVTFTAEQDHQNMMDQLGIKALRPGPSGNEEAPNHANYDESKANHFRICPIR